MDGCSQALDPHICAVCGFTTNLLIELHKHTSTVHSYRPIKTFQVQNYRCKNCDFETFSFLLWLKHYHGKCHPLYCNKCLFITFDRRSLSQHFKEAHSTIKKKMIRCGHCQYRTDRNYALEAHILAKHTDPEEIAWYHCELCPYRGRHKDYLRKHMVSMHRDKFFQCHQCPFQASSKFGLKAHKVEAHSLERNYKCDLCSFSANWKVHLNRHVAEKHAPPEEIQWFECEECDYKAKRKDNLKQHVKAKHSKEQVWFECDQCVFRTKWKKNLKLHKEKAAHVFIV